MGIKLKPSRAAKATPPQAKPAQPSPPGKPAVPPGKAKANCPKQRTLIELEGAPMVVVEASSHEEAWAEYKKVCRISQTDHRPRFSEPADDLLTDDNGVVIDHAGVPIYGSRRPDTGSWTEDCGPTAEEDEVS